MKGLRFMDVPEAVLLEIESDEVGEVAHLVWDLGIRVVLFCGDNAWFIVQGVGFRCVVLLLLQ